MRRASDRGSSSPAEVFSPAASPSVRRSPRTRTKEELHRFTVSRKSLRSPFGSGTSSSSPGPSISSAEAASIWAEEPARSEISG